MPPACCDTPPRPARRRCSRPTARMLPRTSAGISPRTTTSDTAKRPPGFSTRNASAQHPVLVGRQVDDAVGDDDVDRIVRQRDLLDLALQELDVGRRRPCAGCRAPAPASRRSCRGRRPCRSGRPGAPTAARRCRRRSRDRARSRPAAVRPARSDCRSRARPARPPAVRRSAPSYRLEVIGFGRRRRRRAACRSRRPCPAVTRRRPRVLRSRTASF